MPYPTPQEFELLLQSQPHEDIVRLHILQGVPYVFENRPDLLDLLNTHLSNALSVSRDDIIIVGSARIGYSIAPEKYPRQFYDNSDIDVAIVNEILFDRLWMAMLKWQYPMRVGGQPSRQDREWAAVRRKEVWWGWFAPSEINCDDLSFPHILQPVRDMSVAWFNAFQGISQYPELASREITGRLYRSMNHISLYHLDGLRKLHASIQSDRTEV